MSSELVSQNYSKMFPFLVILLLALTVNAQTGINSKLTEKFRWRQVDFQFPNNTIRNSLINSRRFIPENNNMLGVEVWRNKLFITVPRWFQGIGSTLNYVDLDGYAKSPLLIPYPDYASNDIHSGNINDKIISTTRVFADSCNRLWVPDLGKEGYYLSASTVLTPPKLLVYDLITNRLIRKITIGNDVKTDLSAVVEVIVDITNNNCNKAFAYLADTRGYGIIVYSWETDTLRRVSNTYMYFEPQSSVFNNIQNEDGITGMALSGVNFNGYRTLYFHALSSYNEYSVSTQVLQDPNLSSDFTKFKLLGSRGEKGQSTNQRLDEESGIVFYTQVSKNGIGCWNSKLNPFEYTTGTNGMVAVDRDFITLPSSLALDSRRRVWVLSNDFFSFASRTLNPLNFNYIVSFATVDNLIKDTVCKPKTDYSQFQYWT